MLLILALSAIVIVWIGVLTVLCGVCRSAAAGDRQVPRLPRVSQRRFKRRPFPVAGY